MDPTEYEWMADEDAEREQELMSRRRCIQLRYQRKEWLTRDELLTLSVPELIARIRASCPPLHVTRKVGRVKVYPVPLWSRQYGICGCGNSYSYIYQGRRIGDCGQCDWLPF